MRTHFLAVVAIVLLVTPALPAQTELSRTRPPSQSESAGWKWPTLSLPKLPKLDLVPSRPPGTPSAWQRLDQGTRTFFAKTKAVLLMPWSAGTTNGNSSTRPRTAQKKPLFTSSLFGPRDDAGEIETVNDFLESPRPMPFD